MEKLLFVDDEQSILRQLRWAFSKENQVYLADTPKAAREIIGAENPDLVVLDISLSFGGREGLDLLKEITYRSPDTKALMLTGNTDKSIALEAIGMGAYDYYQKPIDIEELRTVIKRGLHVQKLERENRTHQTELEQTNRFENMVGNCPQIAEVYRMIHKISATDATVLITGESGTGKELVARAVHHRSRRKDKPFVVVNCGAIPEHLLESELFGHEKGSFTGAHKTRIGRFELAHEGTLFLDEIGELQQSLQVKLLRFLQERQIERVGGNTTKELDVRILVATNKDLTREVQEGTFREDLYYRISVMTIKLPPLRKRGEDIALLADTFLRRYAEEQGKKIKGFRAQALDRIRTNPWPGNIRELDNRVKRAVIVCTGYFISSSDLGLGTIDQEEDDTVMPLKVARENLERQLIRTALKRRGGNISRSARDLEISRARLHDLIKKYDIPVAEFAS